LLARPVEERKDGLFVMELESGALEAVIATLSSRSPMKRGAWAKRRAKPSRRAFPRMAWRKRRSTITNASSPLEEIS
jgi:hypothetical protein